MMGPIHELGQVRTGQILYHSAFGFARVTGVEGDAVRLTWEERSDHLPPSVRADQVVRVFSLCISEGFFHRALHDPEGLRDLLQVEPLSALRLLLEDLGQPQRKEDLRDWILGRKLFTSRGFDRWWGRIYLTIAEDVRIREEKGEFSLTDETIEHPGDRLGNPSLSPARRIEVARAHRSEIGETVFRKHLFDAWCQGQGPLRDLALTTAQDLGAEVVFTELVERGDTAIDALIHAIRSGGWTPAEVPDRVRETLFNRLAKRPQNANSKSGNVEAEGRLLAALWRWGEPLTVPWLRKVAHDVRRRPVLIAAWKALPPRRAEQLAVTMLEETLDPEKGSNDAIAIREWILRWLYEHAGDEAHTLAARSDREAPRAAQWMRDHPPLVEVTSTRELHPDETTDDFLPTMEGERMPATGPVRLLDAQLEPSTFLNVGLSFARAIARQHSEGHLVCPTSDTVFQLPDGSISVTEGAPGEARRPAGERPSIAADLYSAAIVLVEGLLRQSWPVGLLGDRVLPYLRHVAPELPPSAMAPLHTALVHAAAHRPLDATAWAMQWERAIEAETLRSATPPDPRARWTVGYDTHIGRSKALISQTNQDAIYLTTQGPLSLFLVCDGISTADIGSGDIAAGTTAQVVASLWESAMPRLVGSNAQEAVDFLDRAFRMANQAVCEASLRIAGKSIDDRATMGTTAVAAVTLGAHVQIAWLGDSRAYVVGPYGASLLTADANQSGDRLVEWYRGNTATFDATGLALVRYIGHFDLDEQSLPIPAQHAALTLLPGERLVLCSDGLTDYCAPHPSRTAQALAKVAAHGDLDEAARRLVELANRGGGGDNISVIVAMMART